MTTDSAQVKALFCDPPREYSTGPLWGWNDMLTETQIRDSLRDLARQKIQQSWVHSHQVQKDVAMLSRQQVWDFVRWLSACFYKGSPSPPWGRLDRARAAAAGFSCGSAPASGRFSHFQPLAVRLSIPSDPAMNRAVFLDRDGTLIEEKNYLSRVEEVVIFPGAASALARLCRAGFKLFIVSNQSGVGRGYFTLADVEKVHQYIRQQLERERVRFEKIYVAPEAPDTPSRGRKPSPQFLLDARDEFGLDLEQSYMIGDKLTDLECGWNAGVKQCLLVRTGYGAELERTSAGKLAAAVVVDDLPAAAQWILAQT